MRMAKSEASGKVVDLVELAKEHGAQAIEIADVHEAYKLLTGKQLPDTVPVGEADMALDPATTAGLEEKYKDWQKKLAVEWASILQLDSAGKLPALVGTLRDYTKSYSDAAEALHKKGLIGAAYSRMLLRVGVRDEHERDRRHPAQGQAGARSGAATSTLAALDKMGASASSAFERIGAQKPKTLGGHLQMMAAFKTALRSWVYRQLATQAVAATTGFLDGLSKESAAKLDSPEVADQVVQAVAPTVLYLGRTTAETTLALQELEFEKEDSVQYMCSIPNVRRMATSFSSASVAALNYFDTLLVEPLAKSASVSLDDARNRLAIVEPDYLVAYVTSKLAEAEGLPKELKEAWGEKSLAWGLLSLAGSELAYFDSAELIAKYYSLGVHTDNNNKVDKIEYEEAFKHMLASAERAARANARAARIAAGAIPSKPSSRIRSRRSRRMGTSPRRSTRSRSSGSRRRSRRPR